MSNPKKSGIANVVTAGVESFLGNLDKFFNSNSKAPDGNEKEPVYTGKWNRYSEVAGLIFNLLLAVQYLWLWIAPGMEDVNNIFSLSTLILFEFVMVHSGVFMALMPVRYSLWIFIPFYGLFALAFGLATRNISIIVLYLLVVFNRMRFAFFNVDLKTRAALLIKSFLVAMLYFVLIIILAITGDFLPMFGLNHNFLWQSTYLEVKSGADGLFIDTPHVAMCMGTLYYLLLTVLEYKLMKRAGDR